MSGQHPTAYELLGVLPRASASEITSAYRRLVRRHHPDSRDASQARESDDHAAGEDAAAALGPIIDAYAVLHDPGRRAEYDRRHGTPNTTTVTYGVATNRDFLLHAGPVRWQQDPPSPRSYRRPAVTEREAIEQLLQILRGGWLDW